MACEGKKGQVITTGGIFKKPSGENLTLKEANNELAKCCGIDCCNNLIRLPDQSTGVRTELYFENGSLKVNIDGTIYVATLTAEQ